MRVSGVGSAYRVRPRLGVRGLGTLARLGTGLGRGPLGRACGGLVGAGGAGGVEAKGEAAALAGGGVLVDRPLGGNAVEPAGGDAQLGGGLVEVPPTQRRVECLDLV